MTLINFDPADSELAELIAFRRALHQHPELSGEESQTAATIHDALTKLAPTDIITGLGGHGVAAIFDSGIPGPTLLFRAELDALPIREVNECDWVSTIPGKAHLCGHDGHMTMLLAFARRLETRPVASGRVVLMFQPAEEDGSGAKLVVGDPRYDRIRPDYAFAIHNEPGLPFGYVGTRAGLINCASRGFVVHLAGRTSHAAEPELADSPITLIGPVISALQGLGVNLKLEPNLGSSLDDRFRLVTITHVQSGEACFGITPGEARIFATLRASRDDAITEMQQTAESLITRLADQHNLTARFDISDDFAASINNAEATDIARRAMDKLGIAHGEEGVPMRASEDFGVFGWSAKSAMLCLGPGEDHPALHQPDYDFPDHLIPSGAAIFEQIAHDLLG